MAAHDPTVLTPGVHDRAAPVVCLTIPSGSWNVAAVADAVRAHSAGAGIVAVWCGDPQLRPTLPAGVTWCDLGLPAPFGGWNRLLLALAPGAYEWARTATAVAALLDGGAAWVVSIRVGSAVVAGDVGDLALGSVAVTLVPRTTSALPFDGLSPSEGDLVRLGNVSTAVAGFGQNAQPALRWLATHLPSATGEVGPWLERMADQFEVATCADAVATCAGWRHQLHGAAPVLLDVHELDRDEPWHFAFASGPARSRLSADTVLAAAVAAGVEQIMGSTSELALPGGLPVDDAIRTLVRDALAAARRDPSAMPPEPFGPENALFLGWLEAAEPGMADVGRYWLALREQRADLQTTFAKPQSLDAARLREWAETSWRLEPGRSALLRSFRGTDHSLISAGIDPRGVNVLGYLDFDQSQGHVARELIEAFVAASVPVAALGHHRSNGAIRSGTTQSTGDVRFATNLVVVNADQFEFVVADHWATLLDGRHTIAYWFWELEHVPRSMMRAIEHVDEIWTGSQFIADAFARVTDRPVRCVPLPVVEPRPSSRSRATMGPGSTGLDDDRYLFLVTFDQFSVPERKNPFGVIAAFTSAFSDGEGPLLLIKTMNGAKGWRNHERLLLATGGRSDIVVWDEHLSRGDQMAVLNSADCLVSMHRSEGLGMHCAEAMWLGKPVIATRYSGNLDFMDDSCAAMLDYRLVNVRHGEGIYPEEAMWAEPDVAQAAIWMRRLVDDPALGVDIGRRARQRMQAQPTLEQTGRLMARLANVQPAEGHTSWE